MAANVEAGLLAGQVQIPGEPHGPRVGATRPIIQTSKVTLLGRSLLTGVGVGATATYTTGNLLAGAWTFLAGTALCAWSQKSAYNDAQAQIDEHFATETMMMFDLLEQKKCLQPLPEETTTPEHYQELTALIEQTRHHRQQLEGMSLNDARRAATLREFCRIASILNDSFITRLMVFKIRYSASAEVVLMEAVRKRTQLIQDQNDQIRKQNKIIYQQNTLLTQQVAGLALANTKLREQNQDLVKSIPNLVAEEVQRQVASALIPKAKAEVIPLQLQEEARPPVTGTQT